MRQTVRRRAGRGDVAAHEGEQCVAAKTVKVRRRLGRGMQYRIRAGARCRLVGREPTTWGRVCSSHHMHGFIPFVEEPAAGVSPAIAMRMQAVIEAAQ
jgi:hypothetical protein